MIIKCEQCQTKFRLDDSKVTDKGVKVRCAKCKHVFTVQSVQPQALTPDLNSFLEPAVTPAPLDDNALPQREHESPGESPSFSFPADFIDEPAGSPLHETAVVSQPESATALESAPFSAAAFFPEEPATEAPLSTSTFPDDSAAAEPIATSPTRDFSFPEESSAAIRDDGSTRQESVSQAPADISFSEFDFGESVVEAAVPGNTAITDAGSGTHDFGESIVAAPAEALKPESHGLDFSDDEMFGSVVAPPVHEEVGETITFDFGGDNFVDSMELGSGAAKMSDSGHPQDARNDAPFSLGEIDFGDELTSVAIQQVSPDALKPSQEILFAPLAEASKKEQPDDVPLNKDDGKNITFTASSPVAEELPPLPIASRRKQSPVFMTLLAVGACMVLAVAGYFGFSALSPEKGKAVEETGKISVRGVKASYIKNGSGDELLVISGEALNEYSKPRAALQVKGLVYDAAGQVLTSKTAFGGNLLTEDQIKTMPLDKIEASMANQFGDSLTNLEVAPGKAVPFVVVISKLPAGAKDFGVEAAGSTVATGKQ